MMFLAFPYARHINPPSRSSSPVARPGMAIFTDNPNARSKTMTLAEGIHTHGLLNQRPTQPHSYTIGVSEDKGARRTMEDAFSFIVDFAGIRGQGYFAIFDGHAGKHAAEWCGQHFHENLIEILIERPNDLIPDNLAATFKKVDEFLSQLSEDGTTHSGCTAVTAFLRLEDQEGKQSFAPPLNTLVHSSATATSLGSQASQGSTSSIDSQGSRSTTPTSTRERLKKSIAKFGGSGSAANAKKAGHESEVVKAPKAIDITVPARRVLYTANVGDARAVLCRAGEAVRLTYDHKGSDKAEVRRIVEAGGFVMNNRVNGVLAVTRSLGDSAMKEFVVGNPYTTETELTDDDEYLIIACDGLWDVTDDQQAVDLIRKCPDAETASQVLLKHALDSFSNDNVTVMVVKFVVPSIPGGDTTSVTVTGGAASQG
ncbi:Protein phosphatase 2C 1 [Tulasnella sp. 418]|nr:Protein phosphatase 2C 1 [Tulasnella sp. 418]